MGRIFTLTQRELELLNLTKTYCFPKEWQERVKGEEATFFSHPKKTLKEEEDSHQDGAPTLIMQPPENRPVPWRMKLSSFMKNPNSPTPLDALLKSRRSFLY